MDDNYKHFFCSFSDKRLHKSLERIGKQAKGMDFFEQVLLYDEDKLSKKFRKEYTHLLTANTFYLCVWKPQVILQTFEKMRDGDMLLYADSGCHLNRFGIKRLEEYFDMARRSETGILATVFDQSMPERKWTKGDTFDYFNCRDTPSITDTPQIQATTFIIKKSERTIGFLKRWLRVFTDDPLLADRNYFKNSNLEDFSDHRSDQSFFSILGKINKIELVSANEVQGSPNWDTDMIEYPIWAKRDKEFDNSFWINPSLGKLLLIVRQMFKIHKRENTKKEN
jgi:hypothetical protein